MIWWLGIIGFLTVKIPYHPIIFQTLNTHVVVPSVKILVAQIQTFTGNIIFDNQLWAQWRILEFSMSIFLKFFNVVDGSFCHEHERFTNVGVWRWTHFLLNMTVHCFTWWSCHCIKRQWYLTPFKEGYVRFFILHGYLKLFNCWNALPCQLNIIGKQIYEFIEEVNFLNFVYMNSYEIWNMDSKIFSPVPLQYLNLTFQLTVF